MKKIKFLIIIAIVPCLLAFSSDKTMPFDNGENSKAAGGNVAHVLKIVKDVTFKKTSEQSDWDLAKKGSLLEDGGEVKTGSKSLALVVFIDGSGLLRVRENSILQIHATKNKKSMNKDTFIEKGLIGFEVKKQAPNEEFKFTTPTVVASIRGTDGFLEYSDDSTFTMYLSSGSAGLYAKSDCDSIAAGNTIVIRSNGECISRIATKEDENKNDSANKTAIKKLKIKTEKGEVNIEYYGPGN
jgi:hypothetical protein